MVTISRFENYHKILKIGFLPGEIPLYFENHFSEDQNRLVLYGNFILRLKSEKQWQQETAIMSKSLSIFSSGGFPAFRKTLLKDAETNNAEKQILLGRMILRGILKHQPRSSALSWFERAAKGGSVEAMVEAGKFDPMAQIDWLKKAARLGNASAQTLLISALSQVSPPSPQMAIKWLECAAGQGDPVGQFLYADQLLKGLVVKKNISEAYFWFYLAGQQGLYSLEEESLPDLTTPTPLDRLRILIGKNEIISIESRVKSFVPKPRSSCGLQ